MAQPLNCPHLKGSNVNDTQRQWFTEGTPKCIGCNIWHTDVSDMLPQWQYQSYKLLYNILKTAKNTTWKIAFIHYNHL